MHGHNRDRLTLQAGFAGGHALLIAVAGYPNAARLPSAVVNDAREIAAVLTSPEHCGYDTSNVRLLLDDEATLETVRRELRSLGSHIRPDDTVVIFFSGHGARVGDSSNPQSVLLPFDFDPARFEATTLSETELSEALARITAQRIVVLIDACHSGAAVSFKSGSDTPDSHLSLGFAEKSMERLAQGAGRVLIASSRASEVSLVLAGATNSVFTEHVVGALRGGAHTQGDGLIRVFEVFTHVAQNVRRVVPGRQHPIFKASDLEDNFPMALDRGGTKRTSPVTDSQSPKEMWQQLEEIFAELYPSGPEDDEIWTRAGGDLSRLRLGGSGRANWFAALRTLRQGGGGKGISQHALVRAALDDFPHHEELMRLRSSG